jgi:hypothetical protein
MRSSWIDRLFRHAQNGAQVMTHPSMFLSAIPPRAAGKSEGAQAVAGRASRTSRLCLGIGDGSIHKQ